MFAVIAVNVIEVPAQIGPLIPGKIVTAGVLTGLIGTIIVFELAVLLVRQPTPLTIIEQVIASPLLRVLEEKIFDGPLWALTPLTLKS